MAYEESLYIYYTNEWINNYKFLCSNKKYGSDCLNCLIASMYVLYKTKGSL